MKGNESITVQIKGNGPIGHIVADANASGEVRGYVENPAVDLPLNERGKLDVAGAVGTDGFLYVIKDLGMKEPYRGSVPIVSGELGEDFTYYFAKSEQTPSAVGVGVLVDVDCSVKAAGGFIIQLMPGLSDEEISFFESRLSNLAPVSALIDEGKDLEFILREILGDIHVLEKTGVYFRCKCSRERVEKMLISLGEAEIRNMIEQDGKAEIVCHFCNESYRFNEEQLLEIIKANEG